MKTATYTCDNGYTLNRASTRTCQANGAWSLTAPTCDRECFTNVYVHYTQLTCLHMNVLLAVDCGSLNNIANGQVSTSSGTTFMMTATYTCNTGYNIVGSESRTCRASRVWSGEAPVCNCKMTYIHAYLVHCFDYFCFDYFSPSDFFEQWINECHCQQFCLITGDHWRGLLCPHLSY